MTSQESSIMTRNTITISAGLISFSVLAFGMLGHAQSLPPVMMQPCTGPDQFVCPKPARRTWVIYEIDAGTEHMDVGDAFRLFRTGPIYKLRALRDLASSSKWGPAPINMEDRSQGGKTVLCSIINIHGDAHKLWIELDPANDDHLNDIRLVEGNSDCDTPPPIGGGGARAMN